MWFNSIQVHSFAADIPYQPDELANNLANKAFTPCSALHPITGGFVPPIGDDEDAPLVYGSQGYMLFCFQTQYKVLPSAVLREQHLKKIKALEDKLGRKVPRNEKQQLKEELQHTLLGQAFSQSKRNYGYIDTVRKRLIINTRNKKTLEIFYKQAGTIFNANTFTPLEVESPSAILTQWLARKQQPANFYIMDDGQFEDTAESKGKVKLSKRDLFADSVQTLLAEGCRVTGLRLNWADKICFTLKHDFSITAMRFLDEIKDLAKDNYTETKEERFATDFFIMAQNAG